MPATRSSSNLPGVRGAAVPGPSKTRVAGATSANVGALTGLPVLSRLGKPGHKKGAVVATAWMPDDRVMVASSRFSAYIVMNRRTADAVTREDLGILNGPYRESCVNRGVFWTEAEIIPGRRYEFGVPSTDLPDVVPVEWGERATRLLLDGDEEWCRRFYKRARSARAQRARVARSLIIEAPVDEAADTATTVTLRAYGAEQLQIVRGRQVIGRFHLPIRVLTLKDESDRSESLRALNDAGIEPLVPLPEPFPGAGVVKAHVQLVPSWGYVLALAIHPWGDGMASVNAALFFPDHGSVACFSDALVEAASNLLARHGLWVSKSDLDVPEGFAPTLVAEKVDWALGTTLTGALRTPLPPQPTVRRGIASGVRERVGDVIAEGVRAALRIPTEEVFAVSPTGHRWWTHRNGVLTSTHLSALSGLNLEGVKRPESLDAVWENMQAVVPQHAVLMTAIALREVEAKWWLDLPWSTARSREPQRANTRLSEIHPGVSATTGQPALVDLVRSQRIPSPDLPEEFDVDDEARLWLAAAFITRELAPSPQDAIGELRPCLICDRSFETGTIWLDTLALDRKYAICRLCSYNARTGIPGASGNPVREAAAAEAIRLLTEEMRAVSSLAALRAIRPSLNPDPVRTLLLQLVLPAAGDGGWGDWLARAGVVDDGWRPSFGTYCTAADGHRCRSLLERYIDDFFHANHIPHEMEPSYPYDAELNPTGLRGDWLLPDGAIVEAVGLIEFPDYARKIGRKRELAVRHKFHLIEIDQAGTNNLASIFSKWVLDPSSERAKR